MASTASPSTPTPAGRVAPSILLIGMAGSGKTTFLQRLLSHLSSRRPLPYTINCDPAVKTLPFKVNVDIRDAVSYPEVMSQYNLGPNGGIVTSLNLFSTKMDQVIGLVEKRSRSVSYILIDTPGQIECFVWSASGEVITQALASATPTIVAYVIDTPRTAAPATFMANMLYACSILYKTKLPMVLVFNKTDVRDAAFAKEWMTDFEAFQKALREGEEGNEEGMGGSGYMASLLNSMSLVLEEFYNHLDLVPVSAMTGEGIDEFLAAVEKKVEEFEKDYKVDMLEAQQRAAEEKEKIKEKELGRLMKDMAVGGEGGGKASRKKMEEPAVMSDIESEEDEDEEMYNGESAGEEDDYVPPNYDDEGLKARYDKALRESSKADKEQEERLKSYLNANG